MFYYIFDWNLGSYGLLHEHIFHPQITLILKSLVGIKESRGIEFSISIEPGNDAKWDNLIASILIDGFDGIEVNLYRFIFPFIIKFEKPTHFFSWIMRCLFLNHFLGHSANIIYNV